MPTEDRIYSQGKSFLDQQKWHEAIIVFNSLCEMRKKNSAISLDEDKRALIHYCTYLGIAYTQTNQLRLASNNYCNVELLFHSLNFRDEQDAIELAYLYCLQAEVNLKMGFRDDLLIKIG